MIASLPIACAVCMPDPGSVVSQAQGQAILFMLGLLMLVFSVAFYTIFSFARKQKRLAASSQG